MSSSAGRIRGGYDDRAHLGGEAAYQGRLGATRLEPVHLALDDGRIRTLAVHVGVNVGSDPHLRDAALNGALHRFEGGEELALTYVFHDPIAKKLCVVVPAVLRHQVLDEHAKLLDAIAKDRDASVPAYVREAEVVVGSHGLAAYLERPGIDAIRSERDLMEAQRTALEMERGGLERERTELRRQLDSERTEIERQRQLLGAHEAGQTDAIANERHALGQARSDLERDRAQLEQRESRVRERAEAVTTREDELREQGEQYEAQQRDLAMREQELEQRMEALTEREQAARRAEPAPPERPKTVPPPAAAARAFKPTLSPPVSPIASPVAELEPGDDVEEIDDLDPITTSPGKVAGERAAMSDDAVEEIVDDDDVAEVDSDSLDADALDDEEAEDEPEELLGDDLVPQDVTGVHKDREESGPRTAIAAMEDLAGSSTSSASRMPTALADAEMVAEVTDGVDLYVRLPEGIEGLGELDLLARLSVDEGPTAILELVGQSGGKRIRRRAALDLRNEDDHGVLDQLRRRFEAAVHLFAHDGRPFDEARVSAPREINAARIIDRAARSKTKLSSQAAKTHALARLAPEDEAHPFVETEGELTASAVLATLTPMADALAPERLDHWLTVLSVPRDHIDAAVSRTIERAMTHGLALPTALIERALASAIVTDAAALVVRQIDAFRGTVLRPDRGHLDEEQIADNWERLLKAAADNEVALDSETHDLAFRAIRAIKGDDTGSHAANVNPDEFGELDPPQLVMMLEHPRYRCAAAIALSDKKDAAFADVLCKAVRKMPRHEVVRVMPRLVALGEEAGDALIDGLSARKTFVRQGFALVLGHLKLRRAVVPLLHRLLEEESNVHRELSRVFGSFGNASFRPFARQLDDAKTDGERLAWTLAHLANAGCEKQVAELKKDGEPRTKELATRALTLLAEARTQEEKVTGKRALDEGDSVLAFSRRFEEELRGDAPSGDLAAAPGEE
jgi:hypothetical protein